MQDKRPDPNTLLACVQKDESYQARGKLKIFLGATVGVGNKPGQDVVYISSDLRRLAIRTLLRNPFVVVKRLTGFRASKNPVTLNPSWRKGGHGHVCGEDLRHARSGP
jgi:hypothetical protein